jgi:hypothetical protein
MVVNSFSAWRLTGSPQGDAPLVTATSRKPDAASWISGIAARRDGRQTT